MKFLKNGNLTPEETARVERAHGLIRDRGCVPLDACTFVDVDGTVHATSVELAGNRSEYGSKYNVNVMVDGRATVNNRYV